MLIKLLIINFLIKLYAHKNIFQLIAEKYGQDTTTLSRLIEKKRTKLRRIKNDLRFLTTCKRNKLIPTFAKPKISIKVNFSIRFKIAATIIDAEIRNKQKKQNRLKREALQETNELKTRIGYISLCALNRTINSTINGKWKEWKRTHEKKLTKLFDEKSKATTTRKKPQNTVRNFSSYTLTAEERYILSFGLDHHIESKMTPNKVKTEFEAMYHHLDKQFEDLPTHEKDALKSKIRRTCENYINIPSKSQYER